jgi:hypothetical protein
MEDNGSTCWRQQEELEEKQFEDQENLNLEQESYYLELQIFLDNL